MKTNNSLGTAIMIIVGIILLALGATIALIIDTVDMFTEINEKNARTSVAVGTFTGEFVDSEGLTYHLFKSYDNETWWSFTAEELGFIPEEGKEYTLYYDNNGTTKENFVCEFPGEHDCECYVYDDEFIAIRGGN